MSTTSSAHWTRGGWEDSAVDSSSVAPRRTRRAEEGSETVCVIVREDEGFAVLCLVRVLGEDVVECAMACGRRRSWSVGGSNITFVRGASRFRGPKVRIV